MGIIDETIYARQKPRLVPGEEPNKLPLWYMSVWKKIHIMPQNPVEDSPLQEATRGAIIGAASGVTSAFLLGVWHNSPMWSRWKDNRTLTTIGRDMVGKSVYWCEYAQGWVAIVGSIFMGAYTFAANTRQKDDEWNVAIASFIASIPVGLKYLIQTNNSPPPHTNKTAGKPSRFLFTLATLPPAVTFFWEVLSAPGFPNKEDYLRVGMGYARPDNHFQPAFPRRDPFAIREAEMRANGEL
ncbi:hypothetical protein HDV00_002174 [Rhizophlyctis rosea]|nr:hypothetical protein HDV00_002174 [Rhizophlyctis rosea]